VTNLARFFAPLRMTPLLFLAACGNSNAPGDSLTQPRDVIDRTCDLAPFPSELWTACEAENFAKVGEAAAEQARNPGFLLRWQTQSNDNFNEWVARATEDPSWLSLSSGNTPLTPLCTTWGMQCVGDPFRYRAATGPDGGAFYDLEAEVIPFVIHDAGCARISGRVWAPKGSRAGDQLPNVVIENGSVQAPEPLYWWAAQLLVRAGYVVLTFDPRGQGRSDQQTPDGEQGSNANSEVFWLGLVDVIDFFRSTPERTYPHNESCAGTYPTALVDFNPFWDRLDRDRLGIAGHSLGAIGVSVVQGYGAPDAEPWPGLMDSENPVKVTVAWDGLSGPDGTSDGGAGGNIPLPGGGPSSAPVSVRTPVMNQSGEYGLTPFPFTSPPDPDAHKAAFAKWVEAGVPAFTLTVRGSSHYEWSLLPNFPTSSWCPETIEGFCSGGWGNALAQHYTLAWFDRWLKLPGEPGYDDADARLLDDNGPQGRNKLSYRYKSARSFPDRAGVMHSCEDIRAGCAAP
jgi:hypothetical protein